MADNKRSSASDAVSSNRAQMPGQQPDGQTAPGQDLQDERRDFASDELDGEAAFDDAVAAEPPTSLDIHNLGQRDNPQEDWGEPAGEGATFSANHTRRAARVEAERAQGAKTRRATKDIISRRI